MSGFDFDTEIAAAMANDAMDVDVSFLDDYLKQSSPSAPVASPPVEPLAEPQVQEPAPVVSELDPDVSESLPAFEVDEITGEVIEIPDPAEPAADDVLPPVADELTEDVRSAEEDSDALGGAYGGSGGGANGEQSANAGAAGNASTPRLRFFPPAQRQRRHRRSMSLIRPLRSTRLQKRLAGSRSGRMRSPRSARAISAMRFRTPAQGPRAARARPAKTCSQEPRSRSPARTASP